jgi:hypothetical protein
MLPTSLFLTANKVRFRFVYNSYDFILNDQNAPWNSGANKVLHDDMKEENLGRKSASKNGGTPVMKGVVRVGIIYEDYPSEQ